MQPAQTACPNCRINLRVAAIPATGARVKCPKCGKLFAYGPLAQTESGSAGPGAAVEPTTNDLLPSAAPQEQSLALPFLRPAERADELGRLGHFRVLEELGHGGMGMVFLAEDLQLLRSVALKVMLPQHAASPGAKERFLREARIAAKIENDHIIAIHEVAEDHGVPYLSMPLLKGEVLADRLRREPRLPIAEALRIAWQICDGLQAAHSCGLVHRDLKPANIWLEARSSASAASTADSFPYRVKILDFGLARAVESDEHITRTGVVLGTPSYMAPEQARDPNVDSRADLFSLGVMVFQMATGQLPFRGHDPISLLFAISSDAPPLPNSLSREMPQELSDLIMKLLEKKPQRRFATALEVAAALEAIDADYFAGQAIHSGPRDRPKSALTRADGDGTAIASKLFAFDSDPGRVVALHTVRGTKAPAGSAAPTRSIPWKWLAGGLVTLLCIVLAAQIVIRIRNRDGAETKIDVPKGSTVIVEEKGKAIFKAAPDKPKAKPALAGDPHRRLAEMILNHGGKLRVSTVKSGTDVAAKIDLPKEPFYVEHVGGRTTPIPDQDLVAFEGVYYVQTIALTLAGTAGLRHLQGVSAQAITLEAQDLSGDECVKLLGDRPDLLRLDIRSSSISDASIPLLLKMKNLRGIALTSSKLTEAGIKQLATHPSLEYAGIYPLAPQAAVHLNRLPSLRHVDVSVNDDSDVEALSGLTRAAVIGGETYKLTDEAARRLQKALPNTVILHKGVPPSEAERAAIQWALDRKALVSQPLSWSTPIKEVPKNAEFFGQIRIPEDVVKSGAAHLRGIRCVHALEWLGMENADEEAEHIATLVSLKFLRLGRTNLTAKGMKRLTALERLESLNLWPIPTLTAEALSYVAKFEHLNSFMMNGSPITEEGLAPLSKVSGLQGLVLEYCGHEFTSAGLNHLAGLSLLRHLSLMGTPLSDTAVESLKKLASLRVLNVMNTNLAAADVAELRKALPKCVIFWDGGLIVPGAPATG